MSASEVAQRMGCNESYVRRTLKGTSQYKYAKGRRYVQTNHAVGYTTALRFCRALGLDPVDLGL